MDKSIYQNNWYYISGRVNILEGHLLNGAFFEKLLFCNSLPDILAALNPTPLKAYFNQVKHLYEFEKLLNDYYFHHIREIRSYSPDTIIYDFFLIKSDIRDLKKDVKAVLSGKGINENTRPKVFMNNGEEGTTSLPEIFNASLSFIEHTVLQFTQKRDTPPGTMQNEDSPNSPIENVKERFNISFIVDLILDGAYLRYIEDMCKEVKSEIIRIYLTMYYVSKGLAIIQRAIALKHDMNLLHQYFLAGFDNNHLFRKLVLNAGQISENNLREFFVETHCNASLPDHESLVRILLSNLFPKISFQYEVTADNYLVELIRPVKYIPFGPERVFGYLCGLTTEVFNLKLIIGGKINSIENTFLKERLRKTYREHSAA